MEPPAGPGRLAGSRGRQRAAGPTVLLLVADGRLGYRVLRCMAEVAGRVIVLGSSGESPWDTKGLAKSRFCAAFVEATWGFRDWRTVDQVNGLASRHPGAVVVAADLPSVCFLAAFRDFFSAPTGPVPDMAALRRLARKDDFARLCAEAGIPHPETTVAPDLAALRRLLHGKPYAKTFMLKPVDREGGAGVCKVFPSQAPWLDLPYAPILVQDFLDGEDLSASAFCVEGHVLVFQAYKHVVRRLLGKTVHGRMEFFDSPRLRDLVGQVVAHTRCSGVVNFDARRTPEGEISLIECNPRPWYHMHLAMLVGLNFAKYCVHGCDAPSASGGVRAAISLAPGGLLFPRDLASLRKHALHILADAGYYLSVDWRQRRALFLQSVGRRERA
jgi:hypothetical protein